MCPFAIDDIVLHFLVNIQMAKISHAVKQVLEHCVQGQESPEMYIIPFQYQLLSVSKLYQNRTSQWTKFRIFMVSPTELEFYMKFQSSAHCFSSITSCLRTGPIYSGG